MVTAAFPPLARIRNPHCAARGWVHATIPFVECTTLLLLGKGMKPGPEAITVTRDHCVVRQLVHLQIFPNTKKLKGFRECGERRSMRVLAVVVILQEGSGSGVSSCKHPLLSSRSPPK